MVSLRHALITRSESKMLYSYRCKFNVLLKPMLPTLKLKQLMLFLTVNISKNVKNSVIC